MPSTRIKDLFNLEGKVAIVTGASKGIGECIARGLAEFGASVVVSSRKQEAVDEVAKAFQADGLEAAGRACHVGDADQRANLVDFALERYGRIDILVNNAAANPYFGPLSQLDLGAYQKTMDTNLLAPLALSNLVFPHMREREGGSIIHISSIEGLHASRGMAAYSISKAGLLMLTQSQALEWGEAGIRVNAVCPGLIRTKFSSALWQNEQLMKFVEKKVPAGRIAEPEEMAGLAVYLASDAGAYCTGSVFTADGGFSLVGGL